MNVNKSKVTFTNRIAMLILSLALMIFSFSTNALAGSGEGYCLHGHKLIGGISTVYYSWYNPHNYTAASGTGYYSLIINANSSWQAKLANTTNSSFQSTGNTNTDCNIFFVLNNSENSAVFAGCRYYSSSDLAVSDGTNFGAPTSDYKYAHVICYHQNLSTLTSDSKVKAVFAHETGHVLGLDHVEPLNGRAIMEDPIWQTNVTEPQDNDVLGVTHVGY